MKAEWGRDTIVMDNSTLHTNLLRLLLAIVIEYTSAVSPGRLRTPYVTHLLLLLQPSLRRLPSGQGP